MELQDRVTVVLTQYGANVLNQKNKEFNDMCPKIKPLKTNYKEGDLFTSNLYDIINSFKEEFGAGCHVCFKNIVLAETESSNNENTKKEEDERLGVFAKEGAFRFNGFLFALDTLENLSCPIISTDNIIVKLDKREEFVSIHVYDMLSHAYDTAMDEIAMLRAKLRNIQEIIKDCD